MEAITNLSDRLRDLWEIMAGAVPYFRDPAVVLVLAGVIVLAGAWGVVLLIATTVRPKDDAESGPSGSRAAGE